MASATRLGLAALALVAGVTGCGDDDAGDVDLLSFNLCGNVCAAGDDRAAPFVVDLVDEHDIEVVLLQETCRAQAEHLLNQLVEVWGDAELAMEVTYAEPADHNRCPGHEYGMAILAPSIGAPRTLPLPNPGLGQTQLDERAVLCAEVDGYEACTTHLVRTSNDAVAHDQQVAAVLELAPTLAGAPVVLTGDLNEQPASFDALRAEWVTDAGLGIDQAWATSAHFDELRVSERSCECSDHDALLVDVVRARP